MDKADVATNTNIHQLKQVAIKKIITSSFMPKTLRTILVEDSPEQLFLLREMLQTYCPQVNNIGEASTLNQAYQLITTLNPDLVLLDVEYNAIETGFNLLDRLKQENRLNFQVIFISGHARTKNYAFIALQYAALQCIEKPIDKHLLMDAIGKAVAITTAKDAEQLQAQIDILLTIVKSKSIQNAPFFVKTVGKKWENLKPEDILYLQSDDTITRIHKTDGSVIAAFENIGYYEYITEDPNFFRIEQGCIVNLSHVRVYDQSERLLVLHNGTHLYASRLKDRELRRRLAHE